jgi:hypothetical protein
LKTRSKLVAGLGGLALVSAATATGLTATTATASVGHHHGRSVHAHLDPLNNSGASGSSTVRFHGHWANVDIDARGLAKGLPHAQHIHFGAEARHECPSVYDDTNNDHRLNVAEGLPAYGDIVASLTTSGPTDPGSALAVDRFPTTPRGVEDYNRNIDFTDRAVRRAIASGKGVVVIHGVDYNGNGKYDMAGAGPSELDPSLPAEATDPALCGVLRVHRHHHH